MKKPDFNEEDFRRDITETINKYFIEENQLSINEVLELFELGYKVKYKKEIQNWKDSKKEYDDYMKELENLKKDSIANISNLECNNVSSTT